VSPIRYFNVVMAYGTLFIKIIEKVKKKRVMRLIGVGTRLCHLGYYTIGETALGLFGLVLRILPDPVDQ
jgi:hypothetical protein